MSAVSTPRKTGPKSVKTPKRNALSAFDQSYIEEDDATYVYNGSSEEDSEEEDEDIIEELDEDNSTEVESVEEKEKTSEQSSIHVGVKKDMGKIRQFLVKHEVIRKALHSSIGFVVLYLYTFGVHQTQIVLPLAGLFLVIATNDYIRFQNPEVNKFVIKHFYYLIREKEVNHYNGILYYLLGLILVFAFLPKDISMMSALLLSWADTAASTFGRQFGKYTFQISPGKSFAGALASFFMGVFSCYIAYGYFLPQYSYLNSVEDVIWTADSSKLGFHVYAIICGAVASFSEFVNIYNVDDNFTIPVISGYLLYGVVKAFHV